MLFTSCMQGKYCGGGGFVGHCFEFKKDRQFEFNYYDDMGRWVQGRGNYSLIGIVVTLNYKPYYSKIDSSCEITLIEETDSLITVQCNIENIEHGLSTQILSKRPYTTIFTDWQGYAEATYRPTTYPFELICINQLQKAKCVIDEPGKYIVNATLVDSPDKILPSPEHYLVLFKTKKRLFMVDIIDRDWDDMWENLERK